MTSKAYKRYSPRDAIKNGAASTIESACRKPDICMEFVNIRAKYRKVKTEYQKSQVKLEQMDQLKKDNDSKLIQLTKNVDTINKLRDENRILEETKCPNPAGNNPSLIKNLQNANATLKEQLEKVKEEHLHFNTIWKTEGITEQDIIDMKKQISDQCDEIKELSKATEVKNQKSDNDNRFDMLKTQANEITKLQDEIKKLKHENHQFNGFYRQWKDQSNEIAKLMGKDTEKWSNYVGDTYTDVKELLDENSLLKQENEKYRKIITDAFDSLPTQTSVTSVAP